MRTLYNYRAFAVENYDGDTAKFNIDLGMKSWIMKEPIRLYGMDTPELSSKDPEEKIKAYEAKNYLNSLLFETDAKGVKTPRPVLLQTFKDAKERNGRYVGIVTVEIDGKMIDVSQEMLRKGLAKIYVE